jgi:hypothetical protein
VDGAVRDVDLDAVAVIHQRDQPALCRFRRCVTDRQARGAAREAAIGEQRAFLAESLGLQIGGRIQHFLHARSALRSFVADDHDVARLHFVAEDAGHRVVLAFEHPGHAGELEDGIIDAGRFHDAAALGDVAVEHGQPAVLAEGVRLVADDAVLAVEVERRVAAVLRERGLGRNAAGCGAVEGAHRFVFGAHDVVLVERITQRGAVHRGQIAMDETGAVQFA